MKFLFALFLLFQTTRIVSFASEVNIYNEGMACFYMLASFPGLANLPHGTVTYFKLFIEDTFDTAPAVNVIFILLEVQDSYL